MGNNLMGWLNASDATPIYKCMRMKRISFAMQYTHWYHSQAFVD